MSDTRRFRILMLHNAYQTRGGEDESADDECRVLREAGHHVTFLNAHNDTIASRRDMVRTALSSVWSRDWKRRVTRILEEEQFDVLHVQNFFPQISPSVYVAAQKAGVPVVQAVRNYRLACPAATLLRNGSLCTDCVGRVAKLPAVRHRCYRASRAASATVAATTGVHKIIGTWQRQVDQYLAVSQYVADVLEDEGFAKEKITVKPCFAYHLASSHTGKTADRRDALFVGRLSPEKGVPLLLEAWRQLAPTDTKLNIIGEGTLPSNLPENVKVLGKKTPEEVQRAMSQSAFVVMPGLWPEPFGRVAVEAFSQGTPVIATGIGGVADIVEDGVTGALFEPGDLNALTRHLADFIAKPQMRLGFGKAAHHSYHSRYSPANNLKRLEDIYTQVTKNRPACDLK